MLDFAAIIPVVIPAVSEFQAIPFRFLLVGWREMASRLAATSPPPHPTANALRLAYWRGGIPVRAVRYGQKLIFDRKSVDAWIKRGGYYAKSGGAR